MSSIPFLRLMLWIWRNFIKSGWTLKLVLQLHYWTEAELSRNIHTTFLVFDSKLIHSTALQICHKNMGNKIRGKKNKPIKWDPDQNRHYKYSSTSSFEKIRHTILNHLWEKHQKNSVSHTGQWYFKRKWRSITTN